MLVRFLLAFLMLPATAFAGAWLQPEGKGQLIAQTAYYSTDKFFNAEGEVQSQARFRKFELQPYVEYGLLPNLTVGATAFVQHVSQSGESNNGIADPEFFARTQIWSDQTQRISIQPLVKFKSQFESDGLPRGGSSSTDVELSVLYGKNLNYFSNRDYLDARMGYRYRANELHDQYRADLALGIGLGERWTIVPAARAIIASKIDDATVFSQNGDQDYDLFKAELGAFYKLTDTQTIGANYFHHIYGAQTGSGSGVSLSLIQGF